MQNYGERDIYVDVHHFTCYYTYMDYKTNVLQFQ